MAIDKERIVAAALAILDQYGLADLSMRRIGEATGVQAATIYWHFANKQTLLAAVSDAILAQRTDPGVTRLPDQVEQWATDLRRVLLTHRDAAELVAATLAVGLGERRPDDDLTRWLVGAGWSRSEARAAGLALTHFVLGHVMTEQTRANLLQVGVLKPPSAALDEQGFRLGLAIWVRGLGAC